jgi:hypothetical protein
MPRLPIKPRDRQQWLLDFPKQFYAEMHDGVFLLNIDSDAPSKPELINFSDNGAIVATGAATHTGDELLSVDFPIDAEQYASHGINRATQGVGLIKSLELGLTLDPTLGPNNGAFPACQAKLYDGTIAKGRGIMIPYGRGLAALDGGTSGSIITWESFVKRYQAHPPSADYLYRGQPDNTMDLIPKYFRQTPDDVIKTRFTPHIKDVLDANTASPALPSIRRMAEMQHLGRPTMLLDWTESPLIAAYFAFAPTPKTETKYVRVFEASAKLYRQESPEIFGKKLLTFFAATTLENQKANERAIAQKSHFSFNKIRHISAKLPDPSPLKKCWDISIQERSIALAYLDQKCGISARSLRLED